MAAAGVRPGELVLDVGAGAGVLTDALLAAGASVVAVELHRRRAAALRARFSGGRVTVVEADAADLWLPRRPFRVVANPPFAIVKPLLTRLLSAGSRLYAADLVVPRHVARQWAETADAGRARWSQRFALGLGPTVPRRAFVPPPPRDAKLLVVRRRRRSQNVVVPAGLSYTSPPKVAGTSPAKPSRPRPNRSSKDPRSA